MNNVILSLLLSVAVIFIGCSSESKNEVVVYVSVDQVFSSEILKQFEHETGIDVKPLFDTEASKAVGLERRLLAEKESPRADIFWNSEYMRTARLEKAGVLQPYVFDILTYTDKQFSSKNGTWYGMGIRSRVLIVNTEHVAEEDYPSILMDLTHPKFKGEVAIGSPYFGTTSTHFSALLAIMGKKRFISFLKALQDNDVSILAGNSVVKDMVGQGKYKIGLVDTDDALVGIEQGLPIKMIYYNQDANGLFSLFQSVAMIKNGPNPDNAKKLANWLLSERIEKQLIEMKAVQFPLLSKQTPDNMPKIWILPAKSITANLKISMKLLRQHLD